MTAVFRRVCEEASQSAAGEQLRTDEIGSKAELRRCIDDLRSRKAEISAWHLVGWGEPYGPLLGSPEWPEEISASEWTNLRIPFAEAAKVWLHIEGSDAWLAPFLATALSVTVFGCRRLTLGTETEMLTFLPGVWNEAAGYDPIASLYAEAFADITVRQDECRWLASQLRRRAPGRVLDIGCGNGALLRHLAGQLREGVGVDISREAVRIAAQGAEPYKNLSFTVIDGPQLPFNDQSVDTVVSLLSFRYLDWDPILEEMKRVLSPGGHILIIDMVAATPRPDEWPALVADKLKSFWQQRKQKAYGRSLHRLVTHPAWRKMVDQHPMHLKSEFVWYLKSRFPSGSVRVLNTGARAQVLAFDSGPIG
jgi:ubiquinone/menaquinone biosynthesis C-methylase UbiE